MTTVTIDACKFQVKILIISSREGKMKKNKTTLNSTLLLSALLMLLFIAANNVNAQSEKKSSKVVIEKYDLPNSAVESLIMGIKSDNPGLRRSSIFYAGQYRLEKAVDCLIDALKNEKDPSTKILIALSLYKIGDPIAIDLIKDMVSIEANPKVKNMLSAIYSEYILESSYSTASK